MGLADQAVEGRASVSRRRATEAPHGGGLGWGRRPPGWQLSPQKALNVSLFHVKHLRPRRANPRAPGGGRRACPRSGPRRGRRCRGGGCRRPSPGRSQRPRVKRPWKAMLKALCSTRSMARPASVAMKAGGVDTSGAHPRRVQGRSRCPNTPTSTPAVYCAWRAPLEEMMALTGPVRQVGTAPIKAATTEVAPQPAAICRSAGRDRQPSARQCPGRSGPPGR